MGRAEFTEAACFLADHGEEQAAVELAAQVWRPWLVCGDTTGGRRLLAVALDAGPGSHSRGVGPGVVRRRAARASAGRAGRVAGNQTALAVARAVGDREAEALALVGLSRVAFRDKDYPRVRGLAAEARQCTRDLEAGAGVTPLHMLAAGTRLTGDLDAAIELHVESLELNRRLGDRRMVGMELHNIGYLELHRGNVAAAERRFAKVAGLCDHDDPYEAAMTHLNQAALAVARGHCEPAGELLLRAQATLEGAGIVLDPDDAYEVNWLRDQIGSPVDS